MKITKKGKGIRLTAQTKEDSLKLLEFLETMAGQGNDPNRLSVKKRSELCQFKTERCGSCDGSEKSQSICE